MEKDKENIETIKKNEPFSNADDVAYYILKNIQKYTEDEKSLISTMKLQKLLYYCQVWSIMIEKRKMFGEKIEAWSNGNVIPDVFFKHKGKWHIQISDWDYGTDSELNKNKKAKGLIDSVLKAYGKKSGKILSELTHLEEPWKKAIENSDAEVSIESIYNYFKKYQTS